MRPDTENTPLAPYLRLMAEKEGSDLFFSTGTTPAVKIEGRIRPIGQDVLKPGMVKQLAYGLLSEEQIKTFEKTLELNLAVSISKVGRYRVNIFQQRGEVAMVIRYIKTDIPEVNQLNLPPILNDIMEERRGLILVVGATGSGKSTSLAAMLDHRNKNFTGHILTIEDPMEFAFEHKKSIVNQREVGVDTHSYDNALKEAMREAPDVIMIGEVRDKATMQHAIAYADTGHLCLSTLHATNSHQALDRIIRFFPPEARDQLLMDLSLNLKAIVSQRLIIGKDGRRVPAVEVLLNSPYIAELIRAGRVDEIHGVMEKSGVSGMQTFDHSLYQLYADDKISREEALRNADSRNNLEWRINFGGQSPEEISGKGMKEKYDEEFKPLEGENGDPPSLSEAL